MSDREREGNVLRIGQLTWTDLRVPLSTIKVGATNPPDFVKWNDDGAGSAGISAYHFSPTVIEQVHFDAQLPHAYHEGSEIQPHLHFLLPNVPTAGQRVRFGLEYSYSNVDEQYSATTIIYAERTFDGTETIKTQYIAGFDPDILDPNMKISAMFSCRLFRDATHVNDTYPNDVIVLEFDFHYQSDGIGSEYVFVK